ncbi:MAG: glycerate kinase [Proteobacteria bacterium]|nr:glycerate kinase [Pseudomonadota bacterium]MDA1357318.1 glycerate kinase [Pseudomonadota bacterium]
MTLPARQLLRDMFDAAVNAAQPALCLPPYLPSPPSGRTVVIGAGKAGGAMARAVEDNFSGPVEGLVVTRYGHTMQTEHIEIVEASHPVPDAAGADAARRILELAHGLQQDDLALCLISGGGSALLSLPAPGLGLDDKQQVTSALLRSGATISEINCVRKHLSAIKGGRLAAACHPARVVTLAISDVPGDDPAVIASGPTVPDPTTFADASAVIKKYAIDAPANVVDHLQAAQEESPKPNDARLAHAEFRLIATPAAALEAAGKIARQAGYSVRLLGDALEGDAGDMARVQAALAAECAPGTVLLSGGEATVTVTGGGRGGPNAEYALALALALDGRDGIWAMACDTDGIDGTEDNAGALIAPDSLARAATLGESAIQRLGNNDAYGFFLALGDLVMSGPTMTNVNDFRAILIDTGSD